MPGGQQGLEQIGCIHHAARRSTCTDNGVDFIDKQNRAFALFKVGKQAFKALFKIAPVFGAGQQRTQVQGVNHTLLENIGDVAFDNQFGQALGNGGFTHTALAHQQGVILATSRQNLGNAGHFVHATNQRVYAPGLGFFIEVDGELVERPV